MRIDVLTKEYPPAIYGGAGVHAAELVRALRARGDLDVRVPVQAGRGDFRELSNGFNRMTEQLKTQREELLMADEVNEKRRQFTEAVVEGVSAGRLEDMSLEDVECFLIKKAMSRYDGNVSHAARGLGLSRSALYRRLQRYGL